MAFFGVELNAQVNRLLLEMRLTLAKNQYLPNIRTIYRSCAKYDPEQSGWIAPAQFEKVLNENGIFLKKFQMQVFEKIFSHQGTIGTNYFLFQVNAGLIAGWFAFVAHLREPLSLARGRVIDAVWTSLDSTNAGKIEIHHTELTSRFNASEFKEFKLGFKTKQKILQELMGLVQLTPDGSVTYQQFVNFYTDMGVNIPSDDTFASFVSKMWGYDYKPSPVTKVGSQLMVGIPQERQVEEVKGALRTLRFKLLQRANNTHEEFVLRKLFNQFDVNKNGKLTPQELSVLLILPETMLVKLQIPMEQRLIEGIVDKIARNQSGMFEFQDFARFVFYDPYHL